jgi:hypothetical protein
MASLILTGPLLILSDALYDKKPIRIETACRNAFFRFPLKKKGDQERIRDQFQKGEIDLTQFTFEEAECHDGESGIFTPEGESLDLRHPERIRDEQVLLLVNLEQAELLFER